MSTHEQNPKAQEITKGRENSIMVLGKRVHVQFFAALVAIITLCISFVFNTCNETEKNKFIAQLEEKKFHYSIYAKMDASNPEQYARLLDFYAANEILPKAKRGRSYLEWFRSGDSSFPSSTSFFNGQDAMPTVTITNASVSPCTGGRIDGCWDFTTDAILGDVVAIHIYFENSSKVTAKQSTLSIKWTHINEKRIIFYGGVASSTGPRNTGYATVNFTQPLTCEYLPNTGTLYKDAADRGSLIEIDSLFGPGLSIGDLMPGQQGALVINFRVVRKK